MAGIEVNVSSSTCRKCGTAYGRLKGYFPVSYGDLYKGAGYLPYCKDCIDSMFSSYLTESGSTRAAVRQMCRKLDLYWSDQVFDAVERQNAAKSAMTSYITKINAIKYAGKSYDDTLRGEGALWDFAHKQDKLVNSTSGFLESDPLDGNANNFEVPQDVIAFWGPGYTPEMYAALEKRRDYWMANLPDGVEVNVGLEALIRQIVSTELDINRERAAGNPVDKLQATLNTYLGSAMLKPAQKTEDLDASIEKTPFGVWIDRWENKRPVPDPDPEFQDVDGIVKYVTTWFLGHLCKMLGIKNTYCKLYEQEIAKLRAENPDYAEESDEDLFNDIFASDTERGDPP